MVEFFFVKLHKKDHLPVFLTALLLFLKNGTYDRLKNEKLSFNKFFRRKKLKELEGQGMRAKDQEKQIPNILVN